MKLLDFTTGALAAAELAEGSCPDWDTMNQSGPSLPDSFSRSRQLVAAYSKLEGAIDDFEFLELIGEGAFGKVFLARQTSLDRQVALKVTANLGYEGRTMAQLQHSRIVQVFSESVDQDSGLRLLCMQYIPGATLLQIIQQLGKLERCQRSGAAIIDVLDDCSRNPTQLDPFSLRDRDVLAGATMDEAVCWIGQQLAEALAYAHGQGILHRDIKPANVIVNQYGQPVLTDFSVSFQATAANQIEAAIFGGTMGYMAPEHRQAFDPSDLSGSDKVDERSDIYSFGKVLLELATCRLPHQSHPSEKVGWMPTTVRRESLTTVGVKHTTPTAREPEGLDAVSGSLRRVIDRCLASEPDDRFRTAGELAAALAACRELLSAVRSLPAGGWLTTLAITRPVFFILLFTIVPNVLASAANLIYISLFVIQGLPHSQQTAFGQMVFWYNLVVLIVMVLMVDRTLLKVARKLQADPSGDALAMLRRSTLVLPMWCVFLGCIGWLPFAVVVPGGMQVVAGPVSPSVLWQIAIAFAFTGMIAISGNYFVVSFVVLRTMYPRLWGNVFRFRETASQELAHIPRRNRVMQILAGMLPLLAATLVLIVAPDRFDGTHFWHVRLMVSILIVAGIAGSWFATAAAGTQSSYVAALTGTNEHH